MRFEVDGFNTPEYRERFLEDLVFGVAELAREQGPDSEAMRAFQGLKPKSRVTQPDDPWWWAAFCHGITGAVDAVIAVQAGSSAFGPAAAEIKLAVVGDQVLLSGSGVSRYFDLTTLEEAPESVALPVAWIHRGTDASLVTVCGTSRTVAWARLDSSGRVGSEPEPIAEMGGAAIGLARTDVPGTLVFPAAPDCSESIRFGSRWSRAIEGPARWVVLAPDDHVIVVTGSLMRQTRVCSYTYDNGEMTWSNDDAFGEATAFAVSPSARFLAVGGPGPVCLIDADSGETRGQCTMPAAQVWALAFSPDGTLIAVGGGAHSIIRLFDVRSQRVVYQFHGHASAILALDWTPDGSGLVSFGADGQLIRWKMPPELLKP